MPIRPIIENVIVLYFCTLIIQVPCIDLWGTNQKCCLEAQSNNNGEIYASLHEQKLPGIKNIYLTSIYFKVEQ